MLFDIYKKWTRRICGRNQNWPEKYSLHRKHMIFIKKHMAAFN